MIGTKNLCAIIPARKSSKRLPNKNKLDLCGKPLIAWTIEAAKESKYIDNIIISSDDMDIMDIAKRYSVQFIKRPDILATDEAKTIDVIIDVINKLKISYDFVILLQPTSPLRNHKHIDQAIELLIEKNADAIISLCEMDHNPLWSNILKDDLSLKGFISENIKNKRSQELTKYYRINGAIYICKTSILLKEKTFFIENNIFAYVMDKYSSIDIDDEFDFNFAKFALDNFSYNERK